MKTNPLLEVERLTARTRQAEDSGLCGWEAVAANRMPFIAELARKATEERRRLFEALSEIIAEWDAERAEKDSPQNGFLEDTFGIDLARAALVYCGAE